ncbi:MAG: hypothetical protein GVY04_14365 [Cyanobacteria bacterium]|jgi:hypothetical protein|nr:hypothetical protein [Cyanobacteria bacterium GSL.Bin1]
MIITDLNYLEEISSETSKTLEGGGNIAFNIAKDVNLNKQVQMDINKNVNVNVNNPDQLATAEADAEAFGLYALAEVDAYTLVDSEAAFAYAESTSALDLDQNGAAG